MKRFGKTLEISFFSDKYKNFFHLKKLVYFKQV